MLSVTNAESFFLSIIMRSKIAVCFFGVVSRSVQYTYGNQCSQLIDALKEKYDVDVFVFNNVVDNALVDGIKQNQKHVHLLPSHFYETINQSVMDSEIIRHLKHKHVIPKMRSDYTETSIRNALRQLYAENRVASFLIRNTAKYQAAVVCGSDLYLFKPINISHVEHAISNPTAIYTTTMNDAQGYTNGFYIGSLPPLIKILTRYRYIEYLLPDNKDYEYLLMKSFKLHNLERLVTDMPFAKIRSNKALSIDGWKNLDKKGINKIDLEKLEKILQRPIKYA